jgi:hypothetical protein
MKFEFFAAGFVSSMLVVVLVLSVCSYYQPRDVLQRTLRSSTYEITVEYPGKRYSIGGPKMKELLDNLEIQEISHLDADFFRPLEEKRGICFHRTEYLSNGILHKQHYSLRMIGRNTGIIYNYDGGTPRLISVNAKFYDVVNDCVEEYEDKGWYYKL